jgi:hypothetical protein
MLLKIKIFEYKKPTFAKIDAVLPTALKAKRGFVILRLASNKPNTVCR